MTENTVINNAKRLRMYLNSYSIAMQVLYPDCLPQGALARYKPDGIDNKLEDILILLRKNHSFDFVTGTEAECRRVHEGHLFVTGKKVVDDSKKGQFYAPTFNAAIETDDEGFLSSLGEAFEPFSDDMPEDIFEKLKIQYLNRQEEIFLILLKEATQRAGTYILCDTVEDAVEEMQKSKYKKLWVGKAFAEEKIVDELPNRESTNSANLKGFIFTDEEDSASVGAYIMRQEACILPSVEEGQFITFEDIALFIVGKNLTYIEVKE